MKLKVARDTKNMIVKLELESVDFTELEDKMLNQLGEPFVTIDKNYGVHAIKFSKRIRRGFKTSVTFDARLDSTKETAYHVEVFLKDVKDEMRIQMRALLDNYEEELKTTRQIIDINY